MLYKCKIRTKLAHTDPNIKDNKVQFDFTCKYLIKRPPFSTETYGYPVILYSPQKNGVKKFLYTKEASELQRKARDVARKIKIYRINPTMGFSWSYTSIKGYVFIRNQLINDLRGTFKYKCNECKKSFNSDEMEIHHILERINGGSDTLGNLKLLCLACHLIETWKLMTGKYEVPIKVRWRKVIEAKNKYWRDKWKWTSYARDERIIKKHITHLKGLNQKKVEKIKEERKLSISVEEMLVKVKEHLQKKEDELQAIYDKSGLFQWRLRFWKKYDKKTEKWGKDIKSKK